MRLLNVDSLAICEFNGRHVPPYAILSHTWGKEEVSFKDMVKGRAAGLKGYQKILKCCKLASSEGFKYVWIDTCCIDKRSSAELSEAINSMYHWYWRAAVCYAYLSDVVGDVSEDGGSTGTPLRPDINHRRTENPTPSAFESSRWFTRGWTLQELIAPSFVVFYSKDWSYIGTRSTLKNVLMRITGISVDALNGGYPEGFSVAQKMSWASGRTTTRWEDEAYCLLGLFRVSMPLIYGEGTRAFCRLQEEIMKISDDETIFTPDNGKICPDLLGLGPLAFRMRGSIRCSKYTVSTSVSPFSITNKGVEISLPLIEHLPIETCLQRVPSFYENGSPYFGIPVPSPTPSEPLAVLNCYEEGYENHHIAFHVRKTKYSGIYSRMACKYVLVPSAAVKTYATMKRILIQMRAPAWENPGSSPYRTEKYQHVLIQPFQEPLAPAKLEYPSSSKHGYTVLGYPNGAARISVSISKGFITFESGRITNGEPTALVCSTERGPRLLISFGFANEDLLIAAIGHLESDTEFDSHQARRLLEASLLKPTIAYLRGKPSTTEIFAVTVRVQNTGHIPIVAIHAERYCTHTDIERVVRPGV